MNTVKKRFITQCQNPLCTKTLTSTKTLFCSDKCKVNFYETIEDKVGPYAIPYEIECKCPICEKKYLMLLHWIGNGVPRVFCSECKRRVVDRDLYEGI